MMRKEARNITIQASEYARSIALQMLDQMPLNEIPTLSPTELLKCALDKVEEIMQHRRDTNQPHPDEKKEVHVKPA